MYLEIPKGSYKKGQIFFSQKGLIIRDRGSNKCFIGILKW